MARPVLDDAPQDVDNGKERRQRTENVPTMKIRVLASYILLTLISIFVIYDYKFRPDCLCRPRPYVFAISAFGITGLYGFLGILNRLNSNCGPHQFLYNTLYKFEMTIVLPLFASEVWSLERVLKDYPDLVHAQVGLATPGMSNYFFQNDQKPWMTDASLAFSFSTLLYLGLAHKAAFATLAGVMYMLAYLFAEKFYYMPRLDSLHDEEIINYCLIGFLTFSDMYLC